MLVGWSIVWLEYKLNRNKNNGVKEESDLKEESVKETTFLIHYISFFLFMYKFLLKPDIGAADQN